MKSFSKYMEYLIEGDNKESKKWKMEDISNYDKKYQTKQVLDLFNYFGFRIGNYDNLDLVLKALNDGFVLSEFNRKKVLLKNINYDSNNSAFVILFIDDFGGESIHAGVFKFSKNKEDIIKVLVSGDYKEYKELEKLFIDFISF